MSWFDSEETKIRKSHIMNLMTLAISDGHIDKREQELLFEIASRWGLSPNEFQEILKNPHKVKFTPPTNNQDRAYQLLDLVFMMMIDGKIRESEMDLCKTLAPSLGYPPSIVDKLVKIVVDSINQNVERDILAQKIAAMN